MIAPGGLSLSYVNALAIGKQSRGAAIGLLFYDILISLDREIELVWATDKRRPAFWLYIFNRFFALAYYIFDTIPITPAGRTPSNICVIYLMCDAIVTTVATLTMQVILQLRIYALYNCNPMVMLICITMGHLDGLPLKSTATGCAYQGLLSVSSLFWIPGLVFEPVLFALVAYKAWDSFDQQPTVPLVERIARDSMLYFVVVFIELLVSTIIWSRAPQYINIINPWSAALPSLLGSRLMLSMREGVLKNGCDGTYEVEGFADATGSIKYCIRAP